MNRHMNFDQLIEQLQATGKAYEQAEQDVPVLPYVEPAAMAEQLDLAITDAAANPDEFFSTVHDVVLATPRTATRAFFNQLFGGRNYPAAYGDMLATMLNNSMYTYKVAGPQILIEKEVVNTMMEYVGYTEGDGTLTPGGSMSNFVAMVAARNEKGNQLGDDVKENGVRREFVAYTSADGHYSITKAANLAGIGRANVRKVPTDTEGKMNVQMLEQYIAEDVAAGKVPFFINATAGTTVMGKFDPFVEIATVAAKHDVWMHIDGAWGGSVILSEKYEQLIKGRELADSYTWDAHKMMGVPLTASAILFKNKHHLYANFSEQASYLFQGDSDYYNPGTYSIQCGRRNDALKIWMAWKYYGKAGYAERIERLFELRDHAVRIIEADDQLNLLFQPEATNVCFTLTGVDSAAICDALHADGSIMVGHGEVRLGDEVTNSIRLVFTHPDITEADVEHFFAEVLRIAATITTP